MQPNEDIYCGFHKTLYGGFREKPPTHIECLSCWYARLEALPPDAAVPAIDVLDLFKLLVDKIETLESDVEWLRNITREL